MARCLARPYRTHLVWGPRSRPSRPATIRPAQAPGRGLFFAWLFFAAMALGSASMCPNAFSGPATTAPSGYSAEALYNDGNAAARSGRTAEAILNYERAQLLAPGDPDIAANLATVLQRAGLPVVAQNQIRGLLNQFPPNTWAWLGFAGLIFIGVGGVLGRWIRIPRTAGRVMAATGALAVVGMVGSAVVA